MIHRRLTRESGKESKNSLQARGREAIQDLMEALNFDSNNGSIRIIHTDALETSQGILLQVCFSVISRNITPKIM
jgi:hypothetical protein